MPLSAAYEFKPGLNGLDASDSPASPPAHLQKELQLRRVESPTCTPTIAMSAPDWHSQRGVSASEGGSAGTAAPGKPGATASASASADLSGWVPLSVRQAQAREKTEEEARAKKMAQVVAPVTVDAETGLLCLPEKCLPIKQYQRWLDASKARAKAVERRRQAARCQANKVMNALAARSAPRTFENYSSELASALGPEAPADASTQDPSACGATFGPSPHAPATEHDDGDGDVLAPMLKRCNSWELFAKLSSAGLDGADDDETGLPAA